MSSGDREDVSIWFAGSSSQFPAAVAGMQACSRIKGQVSVSEACLMTSFTSCLALPCRPARRAGAGRAGPVPAWSGAGGALWRLQLPRLLALALPVLHPPGTDAAMGSWRGAPMPASPPSAHEPRTLPSQGSGLSVRCGRQQHGREAHARMLVFPCASRTLPGAASSLANNCRTCRH